SGVTFSEAQKDVIKQLVKTGDVAGAQKVILNELAAQVGGVGNKEGEGLSGSFDSLAQSVEETFLSLEKLTGAKSAVNSFISHLDGGIQKMNRALNPDLRPIGQRIFEENNKLFDLKAQRNPRADFYSARLPERDASKRIAALDAEIVAQENLVQVLIRREAATAKKDIAAKKSAETEANKAEVDRKAGEALKARTKLEKENAKELARHTAKVDGVAAALEFEAATRGKTAEHIAVMNALRRAEVDTNEVIVTQSGQLVGSYDEQIERIAELARQSAVYKQGVEALKEAKKADEELTRQGQAVTDQSRTAMEQYGDTLKDLDGLYNAGKITAQTYARAQTEALRDLDDSTIEIAETSKDFFTQLGEDAANGELTLKSFAKTALGALTSIIGKFLETQSASGDLFG
ncbi:MAG: hypothetical protein V7727_22000, partial [Sneathiella sp.]